MKYLKRRWLRYLAAQGLIVSLLTALSVLLLAAGPDLAGPMYALMMWGVVPLSGALTAFFAARAGVSGYAMLWLPPVCQTAAHWLVLGAPPSSAGMPLTAALVCVIGAAAGEELHRRGKRARGSKGRKPRQR
jgi:hypothetical protein